MSDQDVRTVEDYIEQYVQEPNPDQSREIFRTLAYGRWAMYEILERVIEETERLPPHITGKESRTLSEITDEFIEEMEYYISIARSDRVREIFTCARSEVVCFNWYIS